MPVEEGGRPGYLRFGSREAGYLRFGRAAIGLESSPTSRASESHPTQPTGLCHTTGWGSGLGPFRPGTAAAQTRRVPGPRRAPTWAVVGSNPPWACWLRRRDLTRPPTCCDTIGPGRVDPGDTGRASRLERLRHTEARARRDPPLSRYRPEAGERTPVVGGRACSFHGCRPARAEARQSPCSRRSRGPMAEFRERRAATGRRGRFSPKHHGATQLSVATHQICWLRPGDDGTPPPAHHQAPGDADGPAESARLVWPCKWLLTCYANTPTVCGSSIWRR
jgi:hypothetical protein